MHISIIIVFFSHSVSSGSRDFVVVGFESEISVTEETRLALTQRILVVVLTWTCTPVYIRIKKLIKAHVL